MSFPDYEGKDYIESDPDEPDIPNSSKSQRANSPAMNTRNDIQSKDYERDGSPDKGNVAANQERPGHSRTTSENEGGALDSLLDDYSYGASQPNTPGILAPAEFTKREPDEQQEHQEKNHDNTTMIHSPEPIHSSHVTNIQRIDPNPQRLSQATMSSQSPSTTHPEPPPPPPPKDDPASFAASVLKAFDSPEKSKPSAPPTNTIPTTDPPTNITKPTPPSPPKSPGTSSSSQDTYASSNYWAQMRANLKTKRSASQEHSRPTSHKTDSTTDLPATTTASKSNRSSNESVRSNPGPKPGIVAANDGRSGSFTNYTPPPKFSDQNRRPSSPFGRAAGGTRPTIDTSGGRTVSLTSAAVAGGGVGGEWGQRRGSASDVRQQQPVIDIRPPTGNRSASNSPVMGSMPFSANGAAGPRPGSRGRSREEDVYTGDLPVFAPRDGLPVGLRNARPQSPSRGPPRPQSPSRGPPRPQSPSRGPPRPQSPSRGPPRPQSPSRGPARPQSPSRGPARPQSPSRGPPRPQSPSRGPPPGRNIPVTQVERERRTPSPLKDIPEEMREMAEEDKETRLPPVNRTPSPLRNGTVGETAETVNPEVPPKDIPVPPKDVAPVLVAASVPVQPQIGKKDTLPVVPPVTIPTQPEVETPRSPSPDAEWRDDQEDQQLESAPQGAKRITVFLQEHGKRKESQGLPPLPTEPVPPLPTLPPLPMQAPPPVPREPSPPPISTEPAQPVESPPQSVEVPTPTAPTHPPPAIPTTHDDPVERLKKHFEEPEPPSPLIPPPRAPVLESRGGMTPSASDSSIEFHTAANPVVPPPIAATHRSFPSSSSIQHSIQHSRSASAGTPLTHSREPSRDSPIHMLPELDVSRPITWGPLTFEQAFQTHVKEDTDMPTFEDKKDRLEDVDEESDWEKVEEEEAQEEPSSPPPPPEEVSSPHPPDRAAPEIPDAHRISGLIDDNTADATAPPDSDPEPDPQQDGQKQDDEEQETADNLPDLPEHHTHRSPHPDDASNPASSDIEGDTHPSRYRDRDITSFIIHSRGLQSRDSEKPASRDSDHPTLPPLQTDPVPVPVSSTQRLTLEFLPPFMLGKDILDMTTVAQRVGAYQSRREQMVKTDTGLRAWLLQVNHYRPPSLPQQTPDLRRLSRESYGSPASPGTSALPFTGSGKVGRKMISKMVIGGKKLGAATKNTIDKLGTGDKRTSGDVHSARASGEMHKDSRSLQRLSRDESLESPVIRSSGLSQERVDEEPQLKDINYGNQPVGLGVSTPTQETAMDMEPPTSFAEIQIPAQRPQSPYQPPADDFPLSPSNHSPRPSISLANPVISKKESQGTTRHKFSSSISSVKVSKLFGISTTPEPKPKRHSDASEYSPSTSSPQQSPRQKSKFSRFVNDLSQSSITGKSPQTAAVTASPPPPPPPDKSQFRSPSESTSRLKGFLADLGSRDITGNKPQTSHGSPSSSPRVAADRPSTGSFSRFISELGKRDIMGHTEEERLAAARRREKEVTHVPAQPVVYDESASDWEVKLEKMEDVLPHIRRDVLVESLKQAGGDEQRAIGLAVVRSR